MKPFPWKCGKCRERAVNPATLPTYSADLEHDGRKYHVVLTDMQVAKCENCGTIMLDDAASRRLSDALRNEAGLLQPAEIRANREALGFTQKTLASFLLIAEATLSRWETGAQIQQRAMDAFLRVFFQSSEARGILGVPEQHFKTRSMASSTSMQWFDSIGPSVTVTAFSEPVQWQSTRLGHLTRFLDDWSWTSPSGRTVIWSSETSEILEAQAPPEDIEVFPATGEPGPVILSFREQEFAA
jgi:putative zinc finger/helix-turn-helix YgiT family protein